MSIRYNEFDLFFKICYFIFSWRCFCLKNEFDKIYSKLDTYLERKDVTDENIKSLIDEFFDQYNNGTLDVPDTKLDRAMDKFEEAINASNEKKAIKLAKEAIKIDPDYIDPQLFLIPLENEGEDILFKFDEIINKEEERLKKEGYFDNIGEFYGIWETRPFMRALQQKSFVLIEYGKFGCARKNLEYMLKLNNNDNLGARYLLASIYAYFEDEKALKKLTNKYKENSLNFLVSKLCLYYKLNDYEKVDKLLKKIDNVNPHFIRLIKNGKLTDLLEDNDLDYYTPGDETEVVEVMNTNENLFISTHGIFSYIANWKKK